MKENLKIKKDYLNRYNFGFDKKTWFYTKSGQIVCRGSKRIVYGDRGGYLEVTPLELDNTNMFIPKEQAHRLLQKNHYYLEYRTRLDNVKVYFQKRIVDYADYRIGCFYISVFDLYNKEGKKLIISYIGKKK